jgi:NAD(P) transhydrogenase
MPERRIGVCVAISPMRPRRPRPHDVSTLASCDLVSYDLLVVGSGPAGEGAAVTAAALGKRVALVERPRNLGGLSVNGGTLPAHAVRSAILALGGAGFRARREIAVDDLFWRTGEVMARGRATVSDRLRRSGVHVVEGSASFYDPHTLSVRHRGAARLLRGDRIVLATGTTAERSATADFGGTTVVGLPDLLGLERLPRTATIVGGGIAGLEIASMALSLGIGVTLVEHSARALALADVEIAAELQYHLRGLGLDLRIGPGLAAAESDAVLDLGGRRGATDALQLGHAGVEVDRDGFVVVDAELRSSRSHIFAAGDVVGGPARTAAAREQGRLAALHAFARPALPRLHALAVHTIPEVASVGASETDLAAVPHVIGRADFRELSRADIGGDRTGLLKLLADTETRRILGVHVFGSLAAELANAGQLAILGKLTIDDLADAAFGDPSFGAAYRLAAADAAVRLDAAVAAA